MDSTHNRLHNIRHSNHSRQQQCQQLRQWFIISSRRYRSGCYCISWEIWKVFCDFMRIFLCITIDTDSEQSQVFSSRINNNIKKDEAKIQPSSLNKHGQLSRKSAVANQNVGLTSLHKCVFFLWCGTHNGAGLQFKCVLTDNPPSPGEAGHTTKVYTPYPFQTVAWVLLRPTRTR